MADAPARTHAQTKTRLSVLLPLPLAGPYTYACPPSLDLQPGDLVAVPLGNRVLHGAVWESPPDGDVAETRLKQVLEKLPVPPLNAELRRFIDWVAAYTLTLPGAVLRMCLRSPEALVPPAPRTAYALGGPPPERLTPARARVIEVLRDGPPRLPADLAEAAGVTTAVIKGLVTAGTLAEVLLPPAPPYRAPDLALPQPILSPDQALAASDLAAKAATRAFSATLLEGVTGSGKTEVYFEAIVAALRAGRQAVVLLPEIALTAQWLDRFTQRFGVRPAEWHSELRGSERRRAWRAVAMGEAQVVVGARSALFLPFRDLGLIVVDEEHDSSFKQEEGVIYNARDMAVVRARFAACPVVLASATPALETLANCERGRYTRLHLPERHRAVPLPQVHAIDLRRAPPAAQRFISPVLATAVREALDQGEQAMLFLNRRGYAPLTLCGACGHRLQCPNCTAWLVEHRHTGRLQCHHCGYAARQPDTCPSCGTAGRFKPCGPGIERVAEEVAELFPTARTAVLASDTLIGPHAIAEVVDRITRHDVDILIGTQIVAKGFHFPMLTLVGVVDADLGLAGGDLRAAERTHQLLTQVAGRAGRAERPGRVLLQTWLPDHPVMRALVSGNAEAFRAAEAEGREAAGMPPYGRLAALIVTGPSQEHVSATAHALGRAAPDAADVTVLGPAPAPLALLRGRHRQRLLLRADRNADVQALLRDWLTRVKVPSDVRVTVDVDPYSFL